MNQITTIMKTTLTLCALALLSISTTAQDTLFFEDFNDWPFTTIDDSIFFTYDEDGVPAENEYPGNWFVANFANGGSDSTEIVALSSSWLIGAQDGNRNWMLTPKTGLGANCTLTWKSAPALGQLYMDGYTVLVSEFEYMYWDLSQADTLMAFAENINNSEADLSPGIVHTAFDLNGEIEIVPGTPQYPGILQTWSVDLSGYEGKEVYIAFLHDSDDDNLIAIDDILISGLALPPDTTQEPIDTTISSMIDRHIGTISGSYPNPTNNDLNLVYNAPFEDVITLNIYNSAGQIMHSKTSEVQTGENKIVLNVNNYVNGIYFVQSIASNSISKHRFVKF